MFTAVGGKLDLLKVALDWAVAGDDRPVAVADRGEMRQIMAEDDAVVLLRGCARVIVAITGRAAGLAQALEVAAGMDPAACDLVEQARRHRLDDARMVVAACVLSAPSPATSLTARRWIWSGWPRTPCFSTGWSGCVAGPAGDSRSGWRSI